MATPTVTKQPTESRLYNMDFSGLLQAGETLFSASVATIDKVTVPPLLAGTVQVNGILAQVRLSGGLTNTRYKISITVTTSLSNILEGEGYVQCEDL